MSRVIRSAILQMRVTPGVKHAAEEVLHRPGLTMTEAMELFLHRVIVDQRIPFDVVAFDSATYKRIVEDWPKDAQIAKSVRRKPKAPRRIA